MREKAINPRFLPLRSLTLKLTNSSISCQFDVYMPAYSRHRSLRFLRPQSIVKPQKSAKSLPLPTDFHDLPRYSKNSCHLTAMTVVIPLRGEARGLNRFRLGDDRGVGALSYGQSCGAIGFQNASAGSPHTHHLAWRLAAANDGIHAYFCC